MINLVLLTGFLGSGKTTLMQNILNSFEDKKTAVIVNEFGSINIDAILLKKDGIQVAELSNGSIFCACIKDRFVDSLIEMSKLDVDYLFIEASGLADPANMTSVLKGISHVTNSAYAYRGSICVLDAQSFMELFELLPAIGSQLRFSNEVILNKIDLVSLDKRKKEIQAIRDINPRANIFETSYCKLNIRKVVENMGLVLEEASELQESSNTVANRATTVIVKGEKEIPLENLKRFIDCLVCDSYRIKGFVSTDKGNIEVSTVGENIHLNPWDNQIEKSELVIISSVGIKIISRIAEGIESNLKGYMHM